MFLLSLVPLRFVARNVRRDSLKASCIERVYSKLKLILYTKSLIRFRDASELNRIRSLTLLILPRSNTSAPLTTSEFGKGKRVEYRADRTSGFRLWSVRETASVLLIISLLSSALKVVPAIVLYRLKPVLNSIPLLSICPILMLYCPKSPAPRTEAL